jgi:hypothetical protein
MRVSYLSLESFFGETAGLDGRNFIFALLLLLSLPRAAHELLNPMPGETGGPQGAAAFLFKRGIKLDCEKSLSESEFLSNSYRKACNWPLPDRMQRNRERAMMISAGG